VLPVALVFLNKEPPAWLLRYRAWVKTRRPFPRPVTAAGYFLFGWVIMFLLAQGLRMLGVPLPGFLADYAKSVHASLWYAAFMAVGILVCTAIEGAISKNPPPPEDWLLWNNEGVTTEDRGELRSGEGG
jgi:hypothetical protein